MARPVTELAVRGFKGVVMSGASDAELLRAAEADPNAFAAFYDPVREPPLARCPLPRLHNSIVQRNAN